MTKKRKRGSGAGRGQDPRYVALHDPSKCPLENYDIAAFGHFVEERFFPLVAAWNFGAKSSNEDNRNRATPDGEKVDKIFERLQQLREEAEPLLAHMLLEAVAKRDHPFFKKLGKFLEFLEKGVEADPDRAAILNHCFPRQCLDPQWRPSNAELCKVVDRESRLPRGKDPVDPRSVKRMVDEIGIVLRGRRNVSSADDSNTQ